MISKFAPKRKNLLIKLENINEELRLIKDTDDYFITKSGKVYRDYGNCEYYKVKPYLNKKNGYVYITLYVRNKHKSFRLHRLVANAFLDNPKNLPQVDHIDNNKLNNYVDNLQWVTASENCKKRCDDGLLINTKGYEDSQSIPVICFNLDKTIYKKFGSITQAYKELKISKSTILRQINHKINRKPRCGYYFRSEEEYKERGFVL